MGKIDVKKLKKQLTLSDYEKIIKALNIPIVKKTSEYWQLKTGCHNKCLDNASSKLYFYLDSKIFQCVTQCSASFDIIALCQKRLSLISNSKKFSFIESINFILEVTGLQESKISRINTHIQKYDWEEGLSKYVRIKRNGYDLKVYDKVILSELESLIPEQWLEEGITEETMKKYHIGYYRRTNSTTIPCFNKEGELIGIRVRNWQPEIIEQGMKYMPLILLNKKYNYEFPTNDVFFGINYNAQAIEELKTVILVESEKAVMKLDSWYGNKNIALGMFGHNLGIKRRNELIKMGVQKIIYVPDNDWIGKSKEEFDKWEQQIINFSKQFINYAQVEIVWDNLGLLNPKDNATDCDFETWQKLFDKREVIVV